jgi:hypothetical protein
MELEVSETNGLTWNLHQIPLKIEVNPQALSDEFNVGEWPFYISSRGAHILVSISQMKKLLESLNFCINVFDEDDCDDSSFKVKLGTGSSEDSLWFEKVSFLWQGPCHAFWLRSGSGVDSVDIHLGDWEQVKEVKEALHEAYSNWASHKC